MAATMTETEGESYSGGKMPSHATAAFLAGGWTMSCVDGKMDALLGKQAGMKSDKGPTSRLVCELCARAPGIAHRVNLCHRVAFKPFDEPSSRSVLNRPARSTRDTHRHVLCAYAEVRNGSIADQIQLDSRHCAAKSIAPGSNLQHSSSVVLCERGGGL